MVAEAIFALALALLFPSGVDGMHGSLADSNESRMRQRDRKRVAVGRAARQARYSRQGGGGEYGSAGVGSRQTSAGGQSGAGIIRRRRNNPETFDAP